MHKSQNYLTGYLYCGDPGNSLVMTRPISATEAATLQSCLEQDALDYLHSASVSLGDALRGVRQRLFSWATIKLYYSVFYGARARLALEHVCLFYLGRKAFSIRAQAGQVARKEQGQTHKVVLDLFRRHRIDPFLLSQPIGDDDPLDWLMRLREDVNYKMARFVEPNVPRHFSKIVDVGIRKACQSYLSDNTALYIFDPDHAILAYPLALIQTACIEFQNHGLSVQRKEDGPFFRNLLSDKNGPMSHLVSVFSK